MVGQPAVRLLLQTQKVRNDPPAIGAGGFSYFVKVRMITYLRNIFSCGLILAFLIGVIYGIRFMLQIKQQDKEEYERKKAKDELERKEAELRYQKMLEERR